MNDLPETVTMSTSASNDGDAATNSESGRTSEQQYLDAALRALRTGGHDPTVLPQARDDSLWDRIGSTFGLSLMEVIALKNHACPVVTRSRGVLPRIESGMIYRVSDERIRAKLTISNIKDGHQYVTEAELLVDSGANTELRLPARKVRQLGLEVRGSLRCRGSTNDVCWVLIFSPVVVKATFIRDDVKETVQADLIVKCDKNEYDALEDILHGTGGNDGGDPFATPLLEHQLTMTSPSAGPTPDDNEQASRITVVHLTPTKHRPQNAPLQQAVIGIDGMKKLRLHLNGDLQQLEIEEDEVLDEY
ncbi:hypothetical protein IV203_012383 [Nitzschia inconspicua]|uniref:Uncharacterized protein n=1 Tax=Nitzschia inconspicua TaxID=303405 RepID=A0A9K3KUT6_9STRA|nr:hypothetical protein IV203_012383 [Nitzschia inconspicua]